MTEPTFTIALAQLNPTVGDVAGNAAKARAARDEAAADGADLVVLPGAVHRRLSAGRSGAQARVPGRLPRRRRGAGARDRRRRPGVLVGTPWVEDGKLYNAFALLDRGAIAALRFKVDLPNYGVFDEKRVFARGPAAGAGDLPRRAPRRADLRGHLGGRGLENVVECLAETGAEILLVPNGSPYWRDKNDVRLNIAVARVIESGLPLIYVNQVGGQDELVFDGASFVLNADRSLAFQLPAFAESITTLRWTQSARRLALHRARSRR